MDWRNYSRLPDDAAYWQALADRIEQSRDDARTWLRTATLIAGLSAAAAIFVFLLPATDEPAALLLPNDPGARVMLSNQQPPQLAELLASYNEDLR